MAPSNLATDIEVIDSVNQVAQADWDALAFGDDPFAQHGFLRALERSGSVGGDSGWHPVHVTSRDTEGQLVGVLPLYLKTHSYGEYIFDWSWASAAHRAGLDYYPKLVAMTPLTPTTGQRILHRPDVDLATAAAPLLGGAFALLERLEASSLHLNFLSGLERDAVLGACEQLRPRLSMQFHWRNHGYQSFDDYLGHFRSSLRKQVRKERRTAHASGLAIKIKQGPELADQDVEALRRFYMDTCHKRGSGPYLTSAFFDHLQGSEVGRHVVAVLAYRGSTPVAGTLNFQMGKRLYGRYWGCLEEYDCLHFECCYYALIERAIDQGLEHFEAGAQGTHKLRRGLLPTEIHSAHYVAHPGLAEAVGRFLPAEAYSIKAEIAGLMDHGPFHRIADNDDSTSRK